MLTHVYIPMWSHSSEQDVQHFYHSRSFLVPVRALVSLPVTTHTYTEAAVVLISTAIDSFACPWNSHEWSHTIYPLVYLPSLVHYNVLHVFVVHSFNHYYSLSSSLLPKYSTICLSILPLMEFGILVWSSNKWRLMNI